MPLVKLHMLFLLAMCQYVHHSSHWLQDLRMAAFLMAPSFAGLLWLLLSVAGHLATEVAWATLQIPLVADTTKVKLGTLGSNDL